MSSTWDEMFLDMADAVSRKSKDPRTKVGAVIVSPDRRQVAIGFNGFPPVLTDTIAVLNRDCDYCEGLGKDDLVVHAEMNALLNCALRPTGWTLYCTHPPCKDCAKHILAAGISRLVTHGRSTTKTSLEKGIQIIKLGGIPFIDYHSDNDTAQ